MISKEQKLACELDAAAIAEGAFGEDLSLVTQVALVSLGWLCETCDEAAFDYTKEGSFDRGEVLTALALCITLADEGAE